MNYINVISTENPYDLCVDFGDYGAMKNIDAYGEVHFKRAEILSVKINYNQDWVKVQMSGERSWYLQVVGYTGTDYPIVDKIYGVPQTSLTMLCDTIGGLII